MSALKCDSEFSWGTGWISQNKCSCFICLYEMFVAELSEMSSGSLGIFMHPFLSKISLDFTFQPSKFAFLGAEIPERLTVA